MKHISLEKWNEKNKREDNKGEMMSVQETHAIIAIS